MSASYNTLIKLPDSIGNLTSLRELDLWSNELTTLPVSIGQLNFLEDLDLVNNDLEDAPDEVKDALQKLIDRRCRINGYNP